MSSSPSVPRDQPIRDRLEQEFDATFLVEAGAGSGKTYSLAQRMAAGIAGGHYRVEHMAAVTFTRKAAAELRGRFQQALEARLRASTGSPRRTAYGGVAPDADPQAERARIEDALQDIERFFAGTIHAFCAHLLRERPVEARIAPGFVELDELEDERLRKRAFRDFIARARVSGSAVLRELQNAGVRPADLDAAFARICEHEDVEFPPGEAALPDTRPAWAALARFWSELERLVPAELEPGSRCRALALASEFGRRFEWAARRKRPATLASFLGEWQAVSVTQKWWAGGGAGARAKALLEAFKCASAEPFLVAWRQYVYRLALTLLTEARHFYRAERRRANVVNYVDLLLVSARLLRENASVRHALQRKYRWLFVDEFQDTDPIQAEIFLLLAADEDAAAIPRAAGPDASSASAYGERDAGSPDWTRVRLRRGALFLVGDPKQSIYRFRRADIDIYNRVREIVCANQFSTVGAHSSRAGGEVLSLTANWRSLPAVCALANAAFPGLFPSRPTACSPSFEPLDPVRAGARGRLQSGLARLVVPADVPKEQAHAEEARLIASYITAEVRAGRRRYGDFLVLTRNRPRLRVYADAFDAQKVPVEVSGAGMFGGSVEVRAFALLLRALVDPLDAVTLVGVLRGRLFGLSDAELFEYHQHGGRFDLTAPVVTGDCAPDPDRTDGGLPSPGETDAAIDAPTMAERADKGPGAGRGVGSMAPPGPVLPAVRRLRALYRLTRTLPPGAALSRILEETGWLALAASTPGGAKAGDLLQAVDRVRQVVEHGGGLAEAAAALDVEEDAETGAEVEALPLEPGRRDVVRLMNLHKAKGLEAEVVFLADPCHAFRFDVGVRVVREGTRATGYLKVARRFENAFGEKVLALPEGWEDHKRAEEPYLTAEETRLLYVAATRARDLLVVGRYAGTGGGAAWGAFDAILAGAPQLVVPATHGEPEADAAAPSDVSVAQRGSDAAAREARHAATRPASWHVQSVTGEQGWHIGRVMRVREAVAAEPGVSPGGDPTASLLGDTPGHRADAGIAWGALVHGLLEHAMRHVTATRTDLERLARWLTVETPDLRPYIPEALDVVERVSAADFWHEARQAGRSHVEVPFAVRIEPADRLTTGPPAVLRGVIDLVYESAGRWRVLDYKTDRDTTRPGELLARHAQQLEAYQLAWTKVVAGGRPGAGIFGVRAMRTEWHDEEAP